MLGRFSKITIGVVLSIAVGCGGSGSSGGSSPSTGGPGTPTPTQPNPVQAENALPGSTGWQLTRRAAPGVLEAYTGAPSVQHGEAVDVHVRSDVASRVRWEAWRMGFYGGAGGRLLARGGPVDVGPRPIPSPDPATGRIACDWPVTFRVETGTDWTSGVYLLAITRDDGPQTQVPFVVRADERKGAGVFQASFTTYQAYNPWGGKSLYPPAPGVEVSFDRPFAEGNGSGQFFRYESDFVTWAESRGFDLTYLTNLDVDRDPGLLKNQRIFLSVGHDEYWTRGEREGVQAALDAGTNLAFFSANTAYWQIRLEPARDGSGRPQRTQVGYKDRAASDPLAGTPLETTKWRLAPVSQPENALLGVMFTAWEHPPAADWVVTNSTAWPYQGTGLKDGDVLPGIVGYETDRVVDNGATPSGITLLAHSPVTNVSGRADSQEADFQEAVVRDTPSGAFVFAAGTIEWSWGLTRAPDPRVQRITENVLVRAGLVPSGP